MLSRKPKKQGRRELEKRARFFSSNGFKPQKLGRESKRSLAFAKYLESIGLPEFAVQSRRTAIAQRFGAMRKSKKERVKK